MEWDYPYPRSYHEVARSTHTHTFEYKKKFKFVAGLLRNTVTCMVFKIHYFQCYKSVTKVTRYCAWVVFFETDRSDGNAYCNISRLGSHGII